MTEKVWTRSDVRVEVEESVAKILEETNDLTLLPLYRILHDGRQFRMDNISGRIDNLLKEQANTRNLGTP